MTDQDNIVARVEEAANALPFASLLASGKATSTIKGIFGTLGHSLGYKVLCNRSHYPNADDGEWMYDMVWYVGTKSNGEEIFSRMPLVMESEIQRSAKARDEIDGDFQKLVQARAAIRVWICTSPSSARSHIDNCKRQIKMFSGTMSGDSYVFAVFDWTSSKLLVEAFIVP